MKTTISNIKGHILLSHDFIQRFLIEKKRNKVENHHWDTKLVSPRCIIYIHERSVVEADIPFVQNQTLVVGLKTVLRCVNQHPGTQILNQIKLL